MQTEIFELEDWDAWRVPGIAGGLASLHITTEVELPFAARSSLRITLEMDGFALHADDLGVKVVLTPRPAPEVVQLYQQAVIHYRPVTLTEIDETTGQQRFWLARPTRH